MIKVESISRWYILPSANPINGSAINIARAIAFESGVTLVQRFESFIQPE